MLFGFGILQGGNFDCGLVMGFAVWRFTSLFSHVVWDLPCGAPSRVAICGTRQFDTGL